MRSPLLALLVLAACGGRADAPQAPAPIDPPASSVTLGADVVTLHYGVLGAKAGAAGVCAGTSHTYVLDLRAYQMTFDQCVPSTDGVPRTQTIGFPIFSDPDRARIDAELAKLVAGPAPSSCQYDGPARSLDVALHAGTTTTYLDADYNCLHRPGPYLSASLAPLDAVLSDLASRPPEGTDDPPPASSHGFIPGSIADGATALTLMHDDLGPTMPGDTCSTEQHRYELDLAANRLERWECDLDSSTQHRQPALARGVSLDASSLSQVHAELAKVVELPSASDCSSDLAARWISVSHGPETYADCGSASKHFVTRLEPLETLFQNLSK